MTATAAEAFDAWRAFLGPSEGGLSLTPDDPGNWTSGQPGVGELVGTKFGISGASHPGLDIANLTLDEADHIRRVEYWNAIGGDELHPSQAFVLAEAAYGSGPRRARVQAQQVVKVKLDGIFGPITMAALAKAAAPARLNDFLIEYSSQRLLFEASLANWKDARGGWSRRLFGGLVAALALA